MKASIKINTALEKVIKKVTKRSCSFFELDVCDKRSVVNYIHSKRLKCKVFESLGFDVLTQRFFVVEWKCVKSDDSYYYPTDEKKEFEDFESFYKYTDGLIYENCCFYGYDFNDAEIEKFNLDKKTLNFSSFSKETIKKHSFEKLFREKKTHNDSRIEHINKLSGFVSSLEDIRTFDDLKSLVKYVIKHFDFDGAEKLFFYSIFQKFGKRIQQPVIEYFLEDNSAIRFQEILFYFGREAGEYIIENFDCGLSYTTNRKRIRGFKNILDLYEQKDYKTVIRKGYSRELNVYIYRTFRVFENDDAISMVNIFFDFDSFLKKCNYDLSDTNLKYCPVEAEKIKKYKTDENTILPISSNPTNYEIVKKYEDGEFRIVQRWFGEDNNLILSDSIEFTYICDFIHFMNGDLSNADLLMCDGIENLKNINLEGALIRSDKLEKLNMPVVALEESELNGGCFDQTEKYELQTKENLYLDHTENDDYDYQISYVTDLHLIHRAKANGCKTYNDIRYAIRTIANTFEKEKCELTLIGGDIASNLNLYKDFINEISDHYGDYFITLGNHELWVEKNKSYDEIVNIYRDILNKKNIHFVHNNLFIINSKITEITEEELVPMPVEELRKRTRDAKIVIFGGVGFAGCNDQFNALNDIYRCCVERKKEIEFSNNFSELYLKIGKALFDKNVIILTHMPLSDWCKNNTIFDKFIYVSGHNHKNNFYDDGNKRIYSDNQIGYSAKEAHLKKISMNKCYDWFCEYKDGIYEISRDDYVTFYRGINQYIAFNRSFSKLFMIKKDSTYMFFIENDKGKLSILNGGSLRNACGHNLEYFYNHIVNYSKSVQMFLSKYVNWQKQVASEIKKIGGDGKIHGTIVDIDFFDHLYLNPLDGTITPYFAYSIIDKCVYKNLPSLLSAKAPNLFQNYKRMIEDSKNKNALQKVEKETAISKDVEYVYSTEMYRISKIIKSLQYTINYNVVRLWNDSLVNECSEKAGKIIVNEIINPGSGEQLLIKKK